MVVYNDPSGDDINYESEDDSGINLVKKMMLTPKLEDNNQLHKYFRTSAPLVANNSL